MVRLGRLAAGFVVCVAVAGALVGPGAAEEAFPFGSALLLEAQPLPGTKRVPMIEIEEDGSAALNLWCASVRGSATVTNDTIAIVPTRALPSQCSPEQITRDAGLLTQLSQVTNWRRHGEVVELVGTSTLRFHLMTN